MKSGRKKTENRGTLVENWVIRGDSLHTLAYSKFKDKLTEDSAEKYTGGRPVSKG